MDTNKYIPIYILIRLHVPASGKRGYLGTCVYFGNNKQILQNVELYHIGFCSLQNRVSQTNHIHEPISFKHAFTMSVIRK
jgi:hypothetical protein